MKSLMDLKKLKNEGRKISMVTCYDYWSAQLLNDTPVDCLLVGDSVAMVMHGYPTTVHATLSMMVSHTQAVMRAQPRSPVLCDLPFLAHRKGIPHLMDAAEQIMQAGASGIKIELAPGQEETVRYLVQSGLSVTGHIGLTPQSVHQLGGYKVQGKSSEDHKQLFDLAVSLEQAGCQALVLECVPSVLAAKITAALSIPVIGIGAGSEVDGQVLVLQDLLGLNQDFKPRFVRHFGEGSIFLKSALTAFDQSVKNRDFPRHEESFQ